MKPNLDLPSYRFNFRYRGSYRGRLDKNRNDLNFALTVADFENSNNADYYSLDLVETDVKGTLYQKGTVRLYSDCCRPLTILTPAADAANGVKKLQLREASSDLQENGKCNAWFTRDHFRPGISSRTREFWNNCRGGHHRGFVALLFYQSSIEADPQALIETVRLFLKITSSRCSSFWSYYLLMQ